MTIHNTIKHRGWRKVKGKIIASPFKTVSSLAAALGCHPNAVRGAVEGKCPRVKQKMQDLNIL